MAVLENDPHGDRYVSVYVNETGKHAMLTEKEPVFPQGSVIVLENRDAASDPSPALLTAMVKREPDFAPHRGDWEFLLTDGGGTAAEPEKLAYCWSCHISYRQTDHVARRYLPEAVAKNLRRTSRGGQRRTATPGSRARPNADGAAPAPAGPCGAH
jgi:hypothetical protein